ncbi:MAG TPA: SDR family NAD(P)-dependent oxidoreductase [Pseudonocardiaceae bacterium]|nr:SDR family NAD(P)-dependent oxidoreductase [Pseudonocardiaceae bacterium]
MTNTEPAAGIDRIVDEIVAAVGRVPGVTGAAGAVRQGMRPLPVADPPHATDPPMGEPPDTADRPLADVDGGPVPVPDGAPATLQQALRVAVETAPDKGTIYLTEGQPDVMQTYGELLADAERVLTGLRAGGLRPGDAALFVFADNRDYLIAFWACVLGGFVPTPVAVATTYRTPDEANRKLRNAWHLLDRPVLLTDAGTAGDLAGVRTLWDEPAVRILTVAELVANPRDTDWFPATPDSPVLNLLTSGSTGVPKCVQHTNASVVARSYATIRHCGLTSDDVSLIWMPFDHVTVAFYNVRDVFLRCLHVNARTDHFLGDCLRWLDWIDRYRVTNTWAPNFAFAMVNERAAEIRDRRWDLSCVREMVNAGEPVIAATSHRFLELLAPHGLSADAMVPVWGMSETCSGVTYARQSRVDPTLGTVAVDPTSLRRTVRHLDPADPAAVVLSTVGRPIPGVRLRVVGDDGRTLPEDHMGELRIRGATMKHSYFGNPDAERESRDEDGWFRTGDLAFVHDGEVVIAGRIKDQIIVRGINYLAHELESVVERVSGVRVTFCAAAGVREPGAGSDHLVIFFVPDRWDPAALERIAADVRAVLGREVGLAPDLLVPVTEAEFPKTGSGKIQRAALVRELRAGTFTGRVIGPAGDGATDTWLARPHWIRSPDRSRPAGTGATLVLASDDVLPYLGVDSAVAVDGRGTGYAETGPARFRVAADDRGQLRRLLADVTERYGPLSTVVCALPLSDGGRHDHLGRLTEVTAELRALAAALAGGDFGAPRILVLTCGSVYVVDGDRIDLGMCALPGLVRTAAAELPLPVRLLDLPVDRTEWAAAVRAELAGGGAAEVVAVRRGRRWRRALVPVPDELGGRQPVVAGGLYLLTGGLGGVAHEIAGHLLAGYGVRLLLVGRGPVTGVRAERLAELRGLGDVVYQRVDVADEPALLAVVAAAEQRYGRPLAGVLHLAGADPTRQWADLERHTVAEESDATFAEQYHAKVAGTLAVARLLAERPAASLVLFGSVNGEFGGHSFGAYSAANSFLAGFADHWCHERGRLVHCLAWSMWAGVGMNHGQPTEPARNRGFRTIEPEVGLRLFLDAVTTPWHSLLVGLDLTHPAMVAELDPDRLRVSEVVVAYTADGAEPNAVRAAAAPGERGCPVPVRLVQVRAIPTGPAGDVDAAQLLRDTAPRPMTRISAAPAGDLERRIAVLWSDALNRPTVGRDDSFFELGGNSLRATRLLALVDAELAVRFTTRQLYENPTVAGMAAAISALER